MAFRCYEPENLGHPVCLVGTESHAKRADLHQLLRLPDMPLLLPECTVPWIGEVHPRATGKPINPHTACGKQPTWWKGGAATRIAFVRGMYEYSHYMQDSFDDNGWGCAY